LAKAEALREQVRTAVEQVRAPGGPKQVNFTDPEAVLVKARLGLVVGDNAQAAVAAVRLADAAHPRARPARLVTALTVVTAPDDHGQLLPMLDRVTATTGHEIATLLADAGYHDIATVAACATRGQRVVMPEAQAQAIADNPYHQAHFAYDAGADTYACPEGNALTFRSSTSRKNRPVKRIYRSSGAVCRACPAFGTCTPDARQGRALEVDLHDAEARAHRVWMASEEAKTLTRQRKHLIEPVFGVIKQELGGRRFHLRGLANVEAEWTLLATAFNLRTCARIWQQQRTA
jgi:transposase